jgi:hypothetical protein
MRQFLYILLILSLSGFNLLAQQIDIQVVFNNTADQRLYSDEINKMKESVKANELKTALKANDCITSDQLNVRIAFFDRKILGNLILNNDNELNAVGYIASWKKMEEKKHAVLFLFVKEANVYKFHQLVVSDLLESQHLFPLVMEFINEHLTGGENLEIVNTGTRYLAKALTPVWTDEKKIDAQTLITKTKYHANKINLFHDYFSFGFFDMKPVTIKDVIFLNKIRITNTKEDTLSSNYFYTNSDYLKDYKSDIFKVIELYKSINSVLSVFDISISEGYHVIKDNFLCNILSYVNNEIKEKNNKHHPSDLMSNWAWKKNKNNRYIEDFTGFKDYNQEEDYMILYYDVSYKQKEGEGISILSPGYGNTWCNVYACDLANEVLFGNIFGGNHNGPWGVHGNASQIHNAIVENKAKEFKPITEFSDAWKYANNHYVVYLTAHNAAYYTKGISEADQASIMQNNSGHIATCYPTEDFDPADVTTGKVVQAGTNWGVMNFAVKVWTHANYDAKNNGGIIKANLYLGYILK